MSAQLGPSVEPALMFLDRPERVRVRAEAELDRARSVWDALAAPAPPPTLERTFRRYDELVWTVGQVVSEGRLLARVHPSPELRRVGEEVSERAEALWTEIELDPRVYANLSAIPPDGSDPVARHALSKVLRRLRRNGAHLPDSAREEVRQVQAETVRIGLEFERNIQERVRTVELTEDDPLGGLPDDFRRAHPPGPSGRTPVTTAYPDAFPMLKYARKPAVRRQIAVEFLNQAFPENGPVLAQLLRARYRLARLLGYASYADLVTEDKMVGSPGDVERFLRDVVERVRGPARTEYATLLERKRVDQPSADSVDWWDAAVFGGDIGYYPEKVRSEKYGADSRELREYLPFPAVRDGLLSIMAELFGLQFVAVDEPRRWHPSVEVYDLFDGPTRRGRFYLDLHPRAGKFTHAMCAEVVSGLRGHADPQATLVCNFPAAGPDNPGLMEPSDVATFFHEFGHLLHYILSGRPEWTASGLGEIEWDFVEAPSQFLEEWARDPDMLLRFTRHHATGAPMPRELAERWARAEAVNRANQVLRLLAHAAISLEFYRRRPEDVDPTRLMEQLWREYQLVGWVDGAHPECRFGHLVGYSALYYTYSWSLAIARDLVNRFRSAGPLMDAVEGRRYRSTILEAGSSRPAAELLRDYLGRPMELDAITEWAGGADRH
ncbi:MAG TPA: M3 family metallopeptidase [Thermoplasmata archaeon]|nr:M3 family metallopeptidase [Thermoplasmata archaeon]